MAQKKIEIADSYTPSKSMNFDLFFGNCGHTDPPEPEAVYGPVLSNLYLFQYNGTGSGEMLIDGKHFTTKTGDFLICFPGQVRIERASRDDPWSSTWLEISGKAVEDIIKMMGITRENPVIHGCEQSRIPVMMQDIYVTANDIENPNRAFRIASKIFELYNELLSVRAGSIKDNTKKYRFNYAQQAAYYMDMHYHERNLSVDSMAKDIGLNRSYLYKIFKEEFGMSPQQYLMQLRINKACEFLVLPQATITSVAFSVGYEPPIFSQAFRRVMGIPPSEYREKNMAKKEQ